MNDTPKIMHSWDFAEIQNDFSAKLRPVMEGLYHGVKSQNKDDLVKYSEDAKAILDEYYQTADSLAEYGSGKKKYQFLESHEDDIEFIEEHLKLAQDQLAKI